MDNLERFLMANQIANQTGCKEFKLRKHWPIKGDYKLLKIVNLECFAANSTPCLLNAALKYV